MSSQDTKKCNCCRQFKNKDAFSQNKKKSDGLEPTCKECRKEQRKRICERRKTQTVTITEKKCNTCNETKPINNFTKKCGTKDGYLGQCKQCRSTYRQKKSEDYANEHKMKKETNNNSDDPDKDGEDNITITKTCTGCLKQLPIADFGYKKYWKCGVNPECKRCVSTRQQKVDHQKKLLVQRYLQQQKCKDCGCDDWRLLENDHVNDDKEKKANGLSFRTISKLPTLEKIALELKKCEVVCIRCHRIRTHQRHEAPSTSKMRQEKDKRREVVNNKKLSIGVCALCPARVVQGQEFLFDWDHLVPEEKKDSIADMCNFLQPISSIESEMEKCRLLCCACHRIHTREENSWIDVSKSTEEELRIVNSVLEQHFK